CTRVRWFRPPEPDCQAANAVGRRTRRQRASPMGHVVVDLRWGAPHRTGHLVVKTLCIEAVGAVTALGHDVERTVASLRSGLDAFKEIPFWGGTGEDLKAAPIVGYAEGICGI